VLSDSGQLNGNNPIETIERFFLQTVAASTELATKLVPTSRIADNLGASSNFRKMIVSWGKMELRRITVKASRVNFAYLWLSILMSAGYAYAQQPVNVSACFSPVLQRVNTFSSTTSFDLAYFSQMDQESWKAASKNGTVSVLGIGAASYSEFTQQREKLFQETHLNIHYFQDMKISSVAMDPGAYDVIKECLKDQARRQAGLTYVVAARDQKAVSIRFYWNPTTSDSGLPVRAAAENATSLDPDIRGNQIFPTGAKLRPTGTVVELTRTDPQKPIRIVLKTTPPVDYEPIYIEATNPSPMFKDTWVITTYTDNVDPDPKYKTGEVAYNSVYERTLPFPGPVIGASCAFKAPYYHMEICQPNDPEHKSLYCKGNKERSDTRSAWFANVEYLNPVRLCVANCGYQNDAIVNEDNPANYSFIPNGVLVDERRGCEWKATKVR
jgi:hypothetical protein